MLAADRTHLACQYASGPCPGPAMRDLMSLASFTMIFAPLPVTWPGTVRMTLQEPNLPSAPRPCETGTTHLAGWLHHPPRFAWPHGPAKTGSQLAAWSKPRVPRDSYCATSVSGFRVHVNSASGLRAFGANPGCRLVRSRGARSRLGPTKATKARHKGVAS